jgi:hypothetical protein
MGYLLIVNLITRQNVERCLALSLRKGNETRDFITLYGRAAPVPPLEARPMASIAFNPPLINLSLAHWKGRV